jgi:hypothetical protein
VSTEYGGSPFAAAGDRMPQMAPDFSLVLGGPLYQLLRRARLTDDALMLQRRRIKACGLDALHDRSRAPYRQANRLPFQVERAILGIKMEFPSWVRRRSATS